MRNMIVLMVIGVTAGCGDGGGGTNKLVGEKCSGNVECASGTCTAGACAPWTFSKIDNDIFKVSCEFSSCHSKAGATAAGNLDLQSGAFAALVGIPATNAKAKSEGKNRVTAGDAANSFVYIKVSLPAQMQGGMAVCKAASAAELQSGYGNCMPQASSPLDASQIDGIKSWIATGAPNN